MKYLLLSVVCGALLISCKKKRTCQCELHNYGGPTITQYVLEGSKANTKVECEAIKTNLQVGTSDYVECGIQ